MYIPPHLRNKIGNTQDVDTESAKPFPVLTKDLKVSGLDQEPASLIKEISNLKISDVSTNGKKGSNDKHKLTDNNKDLTLRKVPKQKSEKSKKDPKKNSVRVIKEHSTVTHKNNKTLSNGEDNYISPTNKCKNKSLNADKEYINLNVPSSKNKSISTNTLSNSSGLPKKTPTNEKILCSKHVLDTSNADSARDVSGNVGVQNLIPASFRSDGSRRKERKIRPGFQNLESKEIYVIPQRRRNPIKNNSEINFQPIPEKIDKKKPISSSQSSQSILKDYSFKSGPIDWADDEFLTT
ncbi:hypothetical protein AYI68_g1535 [Smittium mucronatum]|uniref:WIBG Mago-binding domain-containing protein n=1 Tax=Smittium mucronatum TaxID=133383 RepID=A0A1R0H561_9FUNG|nr:hypothetical protein AYI68_g1535 [Smittium mucronatum]